MCTERAMPLKLTQNALQMHSKCISHALKPPPSDIFCSLDYPQRAPSKVHVECVSSAFEVHFQSTGSSH